MKNIFDGDNKFNRFMTKVFDLCLLNLLTFICSLPIITAGAAMTAFHTIMRKMQSDEDGEILSSYIKEFKTNLKGSFSGWLVLAALYIVFLADLLIAMKSNSGNKGIYIGIYAFIVAFCFGLSSWYFSIRAMFDEKAMNSLKNALGLSIVNAPLTIVMGGVTVAVMWLCLNNPFFVGLIPVCIIGIVEFPKVYFITKKLEKFIEDKADNNVESVSAD